MKRLVCLLLVLAVPAGALARRKNGGGRRSWPLPALGRSASGRPEVLFTFDDGPGGALTAELLDTLKARGVHAMFFLVGNRISGGKARAQALIRRMLDEGHSVGSHTQNHRDLCRASQAAKVDKEIDDAQALVEQAAGMDIVLFRAPFGVRCARLEDALDARHLGHIHWDIDAQEWKTHNAELTRRRIIGAIARLGDGERAVVLAHDIHPETNRAIPAVLAWIDEENARRRAAGKKEILILDPAAIAAEKLLPGVGAAAAGATDAARDFGPAIVHRLVLPLAGVAAAQL
ncbi:MAG TPA: polysaccharide deacetylase family protein [Haliangiales bacterium]|nr:polysaccharide deacetylase family protein [Haliangiales bacterium]